MCKTAWPCSVRSRSDRMGGAALMFEAVGKPAAIAALLVSVLRLTACGESSQEEARAQVCSASSEIKKQITKLEGLTINSSFPTEAKTSLEAIDKSLAEVKKAAPNLSKRPRKEEVEAGTEAFETEIATITASVASAAIKSGNAEAALKAAEPRSRPRRLSSPPTTRKLSKRSTAHSFVSGRSG
jgi:Tfp pilus assembly protein PilP